MKVVVAAAVLTLLTVGAGRPCHAATERETHRFLPPFKPIDIRVTIGDVEIRATDRADLVVDIEREAPDAAAFARIPVDLADTEDTLIVNVTQRDGGASGDLRARVLLLVPRVTVVKQLTVVEGRVRIHGLRGTIQARVERGSIDASDVAGILRLETQAGDVTLERAELRSDGLLRIRTFRGAIRIGLATAPRDARILLLTMSGTITSDLALAEREGFGPRFREGIFGTALPLLSADAVRGDIVLTVAK